MSATAFWTAANAAIAVLIIAYTGPVGRALEIFNLYSDSPASIAVAILAAAAARRSIQPEARRTWWLLSAALAVYSAGNLLHSTYWLFGIDPFPSIAGPAPPSRPPDRRVLASASVRKAQPSVVRITATAPARIYNLAGKGSLAIGSDAEAARLAGIKSSNILASAYVVCAAIGGRRGSLSSLLAPVVPTSASDGAR